MIYGLDGVAPQVAEDAWVAPDAAVIGDVVLEAEASVWFGAALRGDNERIRIGARSNVQEGCVLHTDIGFPLTVGPDCTVGHGAILHGCTLGAGCLVGMGATVLNGAVLGEGCLVGAGALVTEGKSFPAGSMVLGAPARAVRELDGPAREALLASAASYVANAARFRAGLRPA
jgi:carbonic anhydrase/acetyltransferase-like protein (isoleucine patch superfamily)